MYTDNKAGYFLKTRIWQRIGQCRLRTRWSIIAWNPFFISLWEHARGMHKLGVRSLGSSVM